MGCFAIVPMDVGLAMDKIFSYGFVIGIVWLYLMAFISFLYVLAE